MNRFRGASHAHHCHHCHRGFNNYSRFINHTNHCDEYNVGCSNRRFEDAKTEKDKFRVFLEAIGFDTIPSKDAWLKLEDVLDIYSCLFNWFDAPFKKYAIANKHRIEEAINKAIHDSINDLNQECKSKVDTLTQLIINNQ